MMGSEHCETPGFQVRLQVPVTDEAHLVPAGALLMVSRFVCTIRPYLERQTNRHNLGSCHSGDVLDINIPYVYLVNIALLKMIVPYSYNK